MSHESQQMANSACVMANAAALNAEVAGMVAENQEWVHKGQSPIYTKVDFERAINTYGCLSSQLNHHHVGDALVSSYLEHADQLRQFSPRIIIQQIGVAPRTLFRPEANILCEAWEWIDATSRGDTCEVRFLVRRIK